MISAVAFTAVVFGLFIFSQTSYGANVIRTLFLDSKTVQIENAAQSMNLIGEGNFDAAIAAAEKVLKTGSDDRSIAQARSVADIGRFMTGEETKRIEAIRITKESYEKAIGDPRTQALQVNKLLGYLNSGYEQYVYDEIFSGEVFGQFKVKKDRTSSIKNLANHSLQLYPTTEALFRYGQWFADRIRDIHGDWRVTPEQRVQYAENTLKVIEYSDKLIAREMKENEDRAFSYMIESRYFFWETYLYGAVARVKPEYIVQSKEFLDKLVASYENSRDEQGNKIPLIATRLPYSYVGYAWSLYEVKGEESMPEIEDNLDALIAIINENPKLHEGAFLAFVRNGAKQSAERQERYYKPEEVLGKKYPPFGEFLKTYGWEL